MTDKCNTCGCHWYENGIDLVYDDDDEFGYICTVCLDEKDQEKEVKEGGSRCRR